MIAEDGEPIEVIYPGRLNDGEGADFRDAVIASRKGLIRGDVEIDVKSSGWREHQHHRHSVYNRVILHVVMWHNKKTVTRIKSGREVPILVLHKYTKTPLNYWPGSASFLLDKPCRQVAPLLETRATAEFLDRAGEARFLAKAASFQRDLAQRSASQSLYQGIMGALGYAKNKLPMLELARRLPLQILESVTQGRMSDEEYLLRRQAWLLGMAGLLSLESQDRYWGNRLDDQWSGKLAGLWTSFRHTKEMSHQVWNLFKVRPNNSPVCRLVAMSYLLLRYQEQGLLEGLVSLIREVPVSRGYPELEKGLMVATKDYQVSHLARGSANRLRSGTLLGRGRAAEIIVNVLLPFTLAWSQFSSQPELGEKTLDLYHHYPRRAVNSVEKHMVAQLGISRSLINSARRQQGLIHINNTLCNQGRCSCCPLAQLEAGEHIQI